MNTGGYYSTKLKVHIIHSPEIHRHIGKHRWGLTGTWRNTGIWWLCVTEKLNDSFCHVLPCIKTHWRQWLLNFRYGRKFSNSFSKGRSWNTSQNDCATWWMPMQIAQDTFQSTWSGAKSAIKGIYVDHIVLTGNSWSTDRKNKNIVGGWVWRLFAIQHITIFQTTTK